MTSEGNRTVRGKNGAADGCASGACQVRQGYHRQRALARKAALAGCRDVPFRDERAAIHLAASRERNTSGYPNRALQNYVPAARQVQIAVDQSGENCGATAVDGYIPISHAVRLGYHFEC